MPIFKITKAVSKRIPCISCIRSLVFQNLKSFVNSSDVQKKYMFKNLNYETIRYKSHSIASADLMSVASNSRATKRMTKGSIKPIYYKGEILYGTHPVYLALLERKRDLFQLFTRISKDNFSKEKNEKIDKIEKLAKTLGISIFNLHRKDMEYLAPGSVHQGVCLDVGPLPVPEWECTECTLENPESSNLQVWLVLNEILDPMNVGAVIRSAYYFGIDRLFVVKGSRCKLSPTVSKASSGALEVMNINQVEKLETFLQVKKTQGWNITSTVAYCENESEVPIQITDIADFSISKPTILILGNESKGISCDIQKLCDTLISIPPKINLHPGIDSLNVSVAAGVILHSLSLRRKDRQ